MVVRLGDRDRHVDQSRPQREGFSPYQAPVTFSKPQPHNMPACQLCHTHATRLRTVTQQNSNVAPHARTPTTGTPADTTPAAHTPNAPALVNPDPSDVVCIPYPLVSCPFPSIPNPLHPIIWSLACSKNPPQPYLSRPSHQRYTAHTTYPHFAQEQAIHGGAFATTIMGIIQIHRANSPVADSTNKDTL